MSSADTSASVFGKPGYTAAQDLGYYLWRDKNAGDWHLRWSGDSTVNHNFTGTITSSTGITGYSEFGFEGNDNLAVLPSGLQFSAIAGAGEDGLDFSVPAGSQLFFDVQLDGIFDTNRVAYGANNTTPPTLPLSIYSH